MSKPTKRTPAAEVLTDLTLDIFRLNNLLLSAGDGLVADLGLTSARWQILGAIARAPHPQPVAWIARNLDAHRQNVQRIVNDLKEQELVSLESNPHHRRALLVVLTDKGRKIYDLAMSLQAPWANQLTEHLTVNELVAFKKVLQSLRGKLEENDAEE